MSGMQREKWGFAVNQEDREVQLNQKRAFYPFLISFLICLSSVYLRLFQNRNVRVCRQSLRCSKTLTRRSDHREGKTGHYPDFVNQSVFSITHELKSTPVYRCFWELCMISHRSSQQRTETLNDTTLGQARVNGNGLIVLLTLLDTSCQIFIYIHKICSRIFQSLQLNLSHVVLNSMHSNEFFSFVYSELRLPWTFSHCSVQSLLISDVLHVVQRYLWVEAPHFISQRGSLGNLDEDPLNQ